MSKRITREWQHFQDPKKALINAMTNWQNHQWLKAGAKRDLGTLERFASLQRSAS